MPSDSSDTADPFDFSSDLVDDTYVQIDYTSAGETVVFCDNPEGSFSTLDSGGPGN
ncbi:hypothetical protein [Demequina sp.]|uniref:hypothetical protein n=1 Tax=Demequina sp. TaxID=2050685 RepID=UPI0025C158FB|nr:hypothetical protein [Demequina sp.]